MKTATQHRAELIGTADINKALQAPTHAALAARKISRETLEKQVADLTGERDALRGLVRDLRDQAAEHPTSGAGRSARETMIASGALCLPNGHRIVLRHIEGYAKGGCDGVTFQMAGRQDIHWSPPTGDRERALKEQAEVMAALDALFAVEQ